MMGLRELGPSMRPGVMTSYPHMLREDSIVWTRFLRQLAVPIEEVWYDVHVGEPVNLGERASAAMAADAAAVSRKRIDAVWRAGGSLWVTEVKPFGGYVALGQVLVYWRLFQQEFREGPKALPCVVCSEADGDCLADYKSRGIRLLVVGHEEPWI